jgi:hypothetical protein
MEQNSMALYSGLQKELMGMRILLVILFIAVQKLYSGKLLGR